MVSTWQIASWLFQNNIFWKTFAGWMELQQFIILKISLPSFVQCMHLFLWNIGSIWNWIYFLHLDTVQHDHWRYSLQKIHRIWILPKTFFEYRDPPFQTDPQKKKTAPKPRSPKENLPSVALVLLIVDDDLQHIIIQDIPIIANRLAYDSRLAKRLGAFILPFFPVNLYING